MSGRYLILDCFVDEPACFGVPPFVSPYPRYIYGALRDAGAAPGDIGYLTIDRVRESDYVLGDSRAVVFLIGGAVVPGKYLGRRIGTASEIAKIIGRNNGVRFAAGGLIAHLLDASAHANLLPVRHDIEKFAFELCAGRELDAPRSYAELRRWAVAGAPLVRLHPDFPLLICEIETSRGCPRLEHCSFCAEGLLHGCEFRAGRDIIEEIDALIDSGISRFRLGRQADIIQLGTRLDGYRNGFPRPRISPVRDLFSALGKRVRDGRIRTLNIDNANPGTIHNFPRESAEILEAIAAALTPGDTLALGVESLDPAVIEANRLKVDLPALLDAVRIVNEIGGRRVCGIPVLLPGVNLIHGLTGESAGTFRINYEGLLAVRDAGLLIKRINIRTALPFPGTPLYSRFHGPSLAIRRRYEFYREKIRREIDHWMLARIYPIGTVIPEMLVEERQFEYSLARQIASYAITARIPAPLPPGQFVDAVVIGHRERSVLALPFPIDINALPQKALELLPGVGKRLSGRMVLERPFSDADSIRRIAPSLPGELLDAVRFRHQPWKTPLG